MMTPGIITTKGIVPYQATVYPPSERARKGGIIKITGKLLPIEETAKQD